MQGDESTLAESIDETLLRAGFALGENYAEVLRTNLRSPVPRHRVLALRGSVRQNLATPDDWRSALSDADVHVRREALNQIAHVTFDDDAVFAALVHCLDDDDALVVDGALFALRRAPLRWCRGENVRHRDESRRRAVSRIGDRGTGRDRRRPELDRPSSPHSMTSHRCADAPSSHSRTSRDPTSTRRWRAPVRTVTGRFGRPSINSVETTTNDRRRDRASAVWTSLRDRVEVHESPRSRVPRRP